MKKYCAHCGSKTAADKTYIKKALLEMAEEMQECVKTDINNIYFKHKRKIPEIGSNINLQTLISKYIGDYQENFVNRIEEFKHRLDDVI